MSLFYRLLQEMCFGKKANKMATIDVTANQPVQRMTIPAVHIHRTKPTSSSGMDMFKQMRTNQTRNAIF